MTTSHEAAPSPGTYTPGLARRKALMILFGVALFAEGSWQIARPVELMLFGERARAEAVDVVKTKQGLPDLVLRSDADIQAHVEASDRSYVFWNEFRFSTADGHEVIARAPVGSQLKPLYPLLDEDGLPTTDLIFYDARHPDDVVFPWIISTWFAAGVLILIGLLAMIVGSILFYWANRPIELPHLPPPPKPPE
jgi:hypothetical protein